MPRKGSVPKREVNPDPKFVHCDMGTRKVIARFVNLVMEAGKKSLAEKIVYGSLEQASGKSGEDAVQLFEKALQNVQPKVEVKSRRVGGATYQVPVDVRPDRARALGMRWLISYARQRGEKTMVERLAGEIVDAANNRGASVKKREDTHRMAEANRAFAHYKW